MKNALLIAAACLLALLSTIGASLPYPILPPLFASGASHGLNQFFGLPPKLVHLVLVNGKYIQPEERLSATLVEGDVLAIWPPIAGG